MAQERTITVKGIGKASARPDTVVLSMRLEARDPRYDKAMETAAQQIEQLNGCLMALGFAGESVKTTNFNVSTEYDNVQEQQGHYRQVFRGFVCSHQLKLTFDFEPQRLSDALGAIAQCLASPQLRVAFTVGDPTAVSEALLREAAANARQKAALLCQAAGVQLGALRSIDYNWSELNVFSNTRYEMGEDCLANEMPRMARAMSITPDDIDVRDTATFVWEIA